TLEEALELLVVEEVLTAAGSCHDDAEVPAEVERRAVHVALAVPRAVLALPAARGRAALGRRRAHDPLDVGVREQRARIAGERRAAASSAASTAGAATGATDAGEPAAGGEEHGDGRDRAKAGPAAAPQPRPRAAHRRTIVRPSAHPPRQRTLRSRHRSESSAAGAPV